MMMDERDPGTVALGCTMEPPLGRTMEALVGHCRVPQDITLAGRTAPYIISGWELRQGSGDATCGPCKRQAFSSLSPLGRLHLEEI